MVDWLKKKIWWHRFTEFAIRVRISWLHLSILRTNKTWFCLSLSRAMTASPIYWCTFHIQSIIFFFSLLKKTPTIVASYNLFSDLPVIFQELIFVTGSKKCIYNLQQFFGFFARSEMLSNLPLLFFFFFFFLNLPWNCPRKVGISESIILLDLKAID